MRRLVYIVTHPITARFLLRGQLTYMRQQGFDVSVVTAPGPELTAVEATERVPAIGVSMRREMSPLVDFVALARLYRVLRQLRPSIVNAGTPKAGLLGMWAARLAGVPIRVYTLRGLRLETTTGVKRGLLTAAERLASAGAHRVICVSASLRARYVELALAPESKTRVLGAGSSNGIHIERFDRESRDQGRIEALRRNLQIPDNAPVVGFVGRFTKDKGIEDLLEVFAQIKHALPAARLLLLGDFERGDPVPEETARRIRNDHAIIRPGFVDDACQYYSLMEVLAFPSYREGFPNALLEAATAGVPVVGYRVTGSLDAVQDGVSGTLVRAHDHRALAAELLRYLLDPELRRRVGKAGCERVKRQFRREQVWQALRDEYFHLMDCKGLPRPTPPPGPLPAPSNRSGEQPAGEISMVEVS